MAFSDELQVTAVAVVFELEIVPLLLAVICPVDGHRSGGARRMAMCFPMVTIESLSAIPLMHPQRITLQWSIFQARLWPGS